jgi:hypothetical protein
MDGARNFAIQRFAKDLLDSIDNFDRALQAVPADALSAAKTDENKDFLELISGLKMTQHILLTTLQKHGLERFDPGEKVDGKAQKFDPNLHEATFMAKAEGLEDGDVMFVQSKGFTLNGRVLRVSTTAISVLKTILTDFLLPARLLRLVSSRTTKSLPTKPYNSLLLSAFSSLLSSLYHIPYIMITIGFCTRYGWLLDQGESFPSLLSFCLSLEFGCMIHLCCMCLEASGLSRVGGVSLVSCNLGLFPLLPLSSSVQYTPSGALS